MNFPYDISLNSAGTFQSGFWYLSLTNGKEYKQGPWNKQIDLKLEKAVKIYRFRFTVFADIKNLFDSKNILAYDNSIYSGAKLWDLNGDPTGTTKTVVGDDGSLFYDIPREVYFGISLDF
jgi:hypothetical protein